jgi:DNA polymerase-1
MPDKVFLLDGHYLIYRSYHAMSRADLRDSKGQPTGAVYGVLRFLLTLFEEYDPDYLVCAMDSEEPTFRHEFYEEYKIQRPEMPDDLKAQLPTIERLFEVLNVPVIKSEGFESDDLLAAMVTTWSNSDREFVIVSNDKDNFQLVDGSVTILKQKQGLSDTELLSAEDVQNELGVKPSQIPDYLSLVGDSVDNIPGVSGVGSTYASRLLQEFDSVEAMLEDTDRITEAVSERLANNITDSEEQIRDSKKLVELRTDAPVPIEYADARFDSVDRESLIEFCRDLDFRSILEDLESELDHTPGWDETNAEFSWQSLDDFKPSNLTNPRLSYLHVTNESSSVMEADQIILVVQNGETVYLLKSTCPVEASEVLTQLLKRFHEEGTYVFSRKKFQLLNLISSNDSPDSFGCIDLKLVSYLVDPDQDHTLDEIITREAGSSVPDYEDDWSEPELGEWLARRAVLMESVAGNLMDSLEDRKQSSVLESLEMPLTAILARMERNGIGIDRELLEDLSEELNEKLASLKQQAYELAGTEFNLNSPKQMREVLFDKLDLPVQEKTDSGKASTNADTLEALTDFHDLPEIILQYRKYNKVESTYLSPLVEAINPRTRKIHTEFNQTVASTGRLSSSNPNLQNIPVREEFGRQVREAFVASRESYQLLAADYSQIELRLLAHMSQDEALLEAFRQDKDVHTLAAADIFDKDESEVDESNRRVAKVVNYGIAYGLSAHGLSRDLDISREEAQNYIDRYFERYPGVRAYLDQTIERAREQGYVETLLGRRRYIPALRSDDFYQQQFAERAAVNAPIQGTAADLMKKAMIDLDPELSDYDCNLLLQVHDELVLEADKQQIGDLAEVVEKIMSEAIDLRVPVTVSLKTGPNWGTVSK